MEVPFCSKTSLTKVIAMKIALNWGMPVTVTQIFVTSVFDKYAADRLLIYFRKRLSFTPQNIM